MRSWSDRWFELRAYFHHCWYASGPHGVHSPFVFSMLTSGCKNSVGTAMLEELKEMRRRMLLDSRTIYKTDLGTGKSGEVKVRSIAVRSAQSLQHSIILARLAHHLGSKKIVELGTSLGMTTAAMGLLNPGAQILSVEGCSNIADIARENMARLNLSNVKVVDGDAMVVMQELKSEILSADFVFIDCNHTSIATQEYFRFLASSDNPNLTIVLDDIYWSEEMQQAWQRILDEKTYDITIDFFHFGMVFRRQGKEREHFRLRLPAM